MIKRILGLDPSLNRLGWCVIDYDDINEKWSLVDYDFIDAKHFDAESEEDKKLQYIHDCIKRVFENYKPSYVISESPFYSRNVKTLTRLSHVHGILLLLSLQNNNRMKYYTPLTIKSTILGGIKTKNEFGVKKNGKELKKEVEEKVFEIFPKNTFYKKYTDDVTDAISVVIAFVKKNGKGFMGEKDLK
jgi:Holliday junction resolvasome RuvABC endonuclease subunit